MSSYLKQVAGSGDQSLNGLEPYDGKLSRTVLRGGEFRRSKYASPMIPLLFHRIFGTERNRDILIHFINDVLELKGKDQIKEVSYLPTIQEPEIAAKKQSVIDVLCTNENKEQIIVEMQVSPQAGFEKRAQYYAAKAYSRQLNKGKEEGGRYKDLKAVIFIAINDHQVFPDKLAYKSNHIILDKETYAHDLKDFSFTFIELPKFKITDINNLTNIVEKWCYFFKHAEKTSEQDLLKIVGSDAVIERAYTELNQFNWTEDELIIYEREMKRIRDNQAAEDYKLEQMTQALTLAKVEGKAEGIAEGIAKGIAEGETKRNIEIAKKMLSKNHPISDIADLTGLSVKEIEQIQKD